MLRVFVYGTLKPGQSNYIRYCGDRVLHSQAAQVKGKLFDLPFGYPAMTPGEDWVKGYLLCFQDSTILQELDELEDYSCDRDPIENEYERRWIEVFDLQFSSLGSAWAYFMEPEKISNFGGVGLPQGHWPNQWLLSKS
jgi:gamma-glutamylcyclotransferase (GGCT)/AIG2-like uncharacterized protein YtfP